MKKKIIILSNGELGPKLIDIATGIRDDLDLNLVFTKNKLINQFQFNNFNFLISFSTSVIVPEPIVTNHNLIALNIHAASPQYPGTHPHHFAVYNNTKEYGATLHFMTKKVDAGPIIDVELFRVKEGDLPINLLSKADKSGLVLYKKVIKNLDNLSFFKENPYLKWGKDKSTREDFKQMCRIPTDISKPELDRRLKACAHPNYSNAFVELLGHKFFYK